MRELMLFDGSQNGGAVWLLKYRETEMHSFWIEEVMVEGDKKKVQKSFMDTVQLKSNQMTLLSILITSHN